MIEKNHDFHPLENCFSNGYAISCLKNVEVVSTWDACNERCLESRFLKIFKFRPLWLIDYYNFGLQLNETNFLSNKEVSKMALRENLDNIHFCTNLRYDFENSKWTNIDDEASFITKWNKKFGDFWNNYPGGYPIQPEEPVRAFYRSEISLYFEYTRILGMARKVSEGGVDMCM